MLEQEEMCCFDFYPLLLNMDNNFEKKVETQQPTRKHLLAAAVRVLQTHKTTSLLHLCDTQAQFVRLSDWKSSLYGGGIQSNLYHLEA